MSYESQIQNFARLGMQSITRLIENNSELMLSVSESDMASKVVSVTRLRALDLPEVRNEDEMYDLLARIFGELLASGKIAILPHGLSKEGRNEFNRLVALASGVVVEQTPEQKYGDVIQIYKSDPTQFNRLRRDDPDFLKRSNEAHSLRLLQ